MTDSVNEGIWKWTNSGNIATYGEPNNCGGLNCTEENFVDMRGDRAYDWNDNSDDSDYSNSICQFFF